MNSGDTAISGNRHFRPPHPAFPPPCRNFTRRRRAAIKNAVPQALRHLLLCEVAMLLRYEARAGTQALAVQCCFFVKCEIFPAEPQRRPLAFGSRLNVTTPGLWFCRSIRNPQSAIKNAVPQALRHSGTQALAVQCCFFVKCEIFPPKTTYARPREVMHIKVCT